MTRARPLLALLLVAAAPLARAQGPAPAEPRRVPIDGLAATVDDRLVTFADINELLLAMRDQLDRTDRRAVEQATWEVVQHFLSRRVQAQGGAELGLSPKDVERVARSMVEDQRRGQSALDYGDRLRALGSDPLHEERRTVSDLYESLWRASVTGGNTGGARRAQVDRYLRPTQLRAAYVQSRDLLGEPPEVELQVLDLTAAQAGGLDAAREEVAAWRGEVVAGTRDFSALVREFSATAREREGRLEPVRADRLLDPDLRRFATTAEPGALSDVLAIQGERGNVVGYRLVKLLARTAGAPPQPFTAPAMQRELRNLLLDRTDRLAIDAAGSALLADAEVWIHPSLQQAARSAGAPQRPPARAGR